MAAVNRTLEDVDELQILAHYEDDAAGLRYHHRVLFTKVAAGRWIIGTPDGDVYEEDFNGVEVRPLARNGAFPVDLAGMMYVFRGPQRAAARIATMREQARGIAEVLGVAPAPGAGGVAGSSWRVADPSSAEFDQVITAAELADSTEDRDDGIKVQRLALISGVTQLVELVKDTDHDAWFARKRPGLPGGASGDLRLLGNFFNSAQRRVLPPAKAIELVTPKTFADWPHPGPKATQEFLESVLENGGDLQVWLNAFMRKSGVSENSSVAHELWNLVQIVRLGISYDQIDPTNLACIEQAVRRIHEIQQAIRRNPKHPDFTGLDIGTTGSCDEIGGARLHSFDSWLSSKQKEEAKTMEAQRKWREELANDLHCVGEKNFAPYQPDLLKIVKGKTVPKPAVDLLPPEEAAFLIDPDRYLVRSQPEIDAWNEERPTFRPYWGPHLRQDRAARLDLYRKLYSKGLLGFRTRIKAQVGIFFVWKSSRRGIRLIVDARMPNGHHRLPPKTRLGGASALAQLDGWLDQDELASLAQGCGPIAEIPNLSVCVGDVEDAFYQFSVESMAEWFGLDDPVRCSEFGLSQIFDNDLGGLRPARPTEKVFPVFLWMPQGWSWALHFCTTSVKHFTSAAIGGKHRLVQEGLPAPDLRSGPVSSVYLDKLATVGLSSSEVASDYAAIKRELESAGFTLHEEGGDAMLVENVGIVIDKSRCSIRHKSERAWRLYLGIKYVLKLRRVTGEAVRVLLGHCIHYLVLLRPAMSVFAHAYRFVNSSLGRTCELPGQVKREFRLMAGLVFLAEARLSVPPSDRAYCGDASGKGYAVMDTPMGPVEFRKLTRWKERWRFVEVEGDRGDILKASGNLPPPNPGWSADLEVPDTSYSRWLLESAGIPTPSSGVLESGGFRSGVCKLRGKERRQLEQKEIVGMVPIPPESVVDPGRWRTLAEGRWKRDEAIHMKEGRVILMALRRESYTRSGHGRRLLVLSDKLSSLCCLEKGRAKDFGLLALARRCAAYSIGRGIDLRSFTGSEKERLWVCIVLAVRQGRECSTVFVSFAVLTMLYETLRASLPGALVGMRGSD
ncbi:unnamed protein product, partial [Prorocentrum cordatum]